MRWSIEMTHERLAAATIELEWVLQRQNRRAADRMPSSRMSIARRRMLLLVLSLAIALLLALEAATSRRPLVGTWHFVLGVTVAACGVLGAMMLPTIRAWSTRTAGAMLHRRAERMLRPLAAFMPYTAEYELDDTRVSWRIEKMNLQRAVAFAAVRRALATPGLVAVFRRRISLRPYRIVYAAGEERAALLAALRAAGVECEEITGAIEGYVAPVPEARAL